MCVVCVRVCACAFHHSCEDLLLAVDWCSTTAASLFGAFTVAAAWRLCCMYVQSYSFSTPNAAFERIMNGAFMQPVRMIQFELGGVRLADTIIKSKMARFKILIDIWLSNRQAFCCEQPFHHLLHTHRPWSPNERMKATFFQPPSPGKGQIGSKGTTESKTMSSFQGGQEVENKDVVWSDFEILWKAVKGWHESGEATWELLWTAVRSSHSCYQWHVLATTCITKRMDQLSTCLMITKFVDIKRPWAFLTQLQMASLKLGWDDPTLTVLVRCPSDAHL